MDREAQIVRAGTISIVGNILLAVVKGVAGVISGSIAISLDALNSLTDALSSVIAIIGTKLAGKEANRDHPFGYGRMEYLASIVISALILAAGVSSLLEAIRSIIQPKPSQYSVFILVVVAMAALVKFGLGVFLLREGKRLNSGSLTGAGTDSLLDGGVSTATCVAGILYLTTSISIESWLAACIALLIIRGGLLLLIDTSSKLLGERADPAIVEKVERAARAVEGVRLASGLVLMDFGPNRMGGSIHVTVNGKMTVAEFDGVAREVQQHVYDKTGVKLAGVTPYADISDDESLSELRSTVGRIVWSHDDVVELRGLYVDKQTSVVRFDAIVPFGSGDIRALHDQIIKACEDACPGWTFEARVIPEFGD